jgi:hypothetical protein
MQAPRSAPATRALVAAAALVGVAATACGDVLVPGDVAGRYALREIDGTPLPAVSFSSAEVTRRVHADTIRLGADGRGMEVSVVETTFAGGARHGPQRTETQLGYRIVGGRVEISYACPPNANCVAGPHLIARYRDGALDVVYGFGDRAPVVFARVGDAR